MFDNKSDYALNKKDQDSMPTAACIIPTTRDAWQKWWTRLQGTA